MSVLNITSEDTTNKKEAKITLIGDPHTGKASLLLSYMSGKFFEGFGIWDPFTNYTKEKEIDGEQYKLTLCTMLGQQDYNSLRPLGYPKTTCFLLCYSINRRETCRSIKEKWVPEIRHYMPDTPFILVGLKNDFRQADDPKLKLVSVKKGEKLALEIGAESYLECSAKNLRSFDEIVVEAVRTGKRERKEDIKQERKCILV